MSDGRAKKDPDQPSAEGRHTGTRRRGKALEDAILHAAWNELSEVGYNDLTMEHVAARAGTNKAVLYRRWANKSELVVTALDRFLPHAIYDIPDTGNLRSDVYAYLHGLADPLRSIGAQAIGVLITERMGSTLMASLPQIIGPRSESKMTAAMTTILKNAELRGEVRPEKLTERIVSLPVDLLRYELITRQEPISDEAIAEIVDDIFLPLVCV